MQGAVRVSLTHRGMNSSPSRSPDGIAPKFACFLGHDNSASVDWVWRYAGGMACRGEQTEQLQRQDTYTATGMNWIGFTIHPLHMCSQSRADTGSTDVQALTPACWCTHGAR